MFNAMAKVTTGLDNTNAIKSLLDDLAKKQVYIGIPEGSGNDRAEGTGSKQVNSDITNSELLYVLSHGIRHHEMRAEMNPDIESGAVTYSKAYDLYIHSHGSPLWQAPPRPVLEPSIEHNKEAIAKQLKKVMQTALNGQDPTAELEKAGMLGQNVARDWFTNPANGWAPNSPLTIEQKGSDKPNIDTGEMRKAIVYVVSDGG